MTCRAVAVDEVMIDRESKTGHIHSATSVLALGRPACSQRPCVAQRCLP